MTVALFSLMSLIFTTAGLPSVVTAHGIDSDGDLYSPEDGDCNDDDPTIFPGAVPSGDLQRFKLYRPARFDRLQHTCRHLHHIEAVNP